MIIKKFHRGIFLAWFLSIVLSTALAFLSFAPSAYAANDNLYDDGSSEATVLKDLSYSADTSPKSASSVNSGEWYDSGTCEWMIDEEYCLNIRPKDGIRGELDISDNESWKSIKSVKSQGAIELSESCNSMFRDCSSLKSLDLSSWDVSNAVYMYDMFNGCSSLEYLDVSSWNVSNANDMDGMFNGCSSLEYLDVSSWDVSNVMLMSDMFNGCSSLESLDVSSWDVSNVVYMGTMFQGCSSLKSLDVSSWNVSSVNDMSCMFASCSSLNSLNVSSWNVSNANDMDGMFFGCSSLESLDVSSWNVSNVKNMGDMFNGCSSLKSLDVSSWDVSSVFVMERMLNGCSSLESIDVSSWNVSNVVYMDMMFNGCSCIQTLDLSSWDVSKVRDASDMFCECGLKEITLGKGWESQKYMYIHICHDEETHANKESLMLVSKDAVNKGPMSSYELFSSYNSETMAGTWTVVDIESVDIAGAVISGVTTKTYTGSAITQSLTVTYDGKVLTIGSDYTISYSDNTNAGTATVIVTGKGLYKGTKRVTFTISPKAISSANVSAISDQTYTGSALTPAPTIKDGSKSLRAGTDFTLVYSNNVNVGNATIRIAGKGNYTGSKSTTFRITSMSIAGATISSIPSFVYTGSPFVPVPVITYGSRALANGIDFTLAYTNNVNAGIAMVTVMGKGNYSGTKIATFQISKAKNTLSVKAVVKAVKASKLKKRAQVISGAIKFSKKGQGTITYTKSSGKKNLTINKKTGKVTVKKGTKKGTYKIKVRVKASGNVNFNAMTKTVTITLKVK